MQSFRNFTTYFLNFEVFLLNHHTNNFYCFRGMWGNCPPPPIGMVPHQTFGKLWQLRPWLSTQCLPQAPPDFCPWRTPCTQGRSYNRGKGGQLPPPPPIGIAPPQTFGKSKFPMGNDKFFSDSVETLQNLSNIL